VTVVRAEPLLEGTANGPVFALDEPLSFWGGVDPHRGLIVDRRHPQHGASVTGRILVMPHGRGSSSSSYVLAELIRAGLGPAAIVTREPDRIIVLGALVAAELYPDRRCPVLVADRDYAAVAAAALATIDADGRIELA
jgi:predicted aconitase with swiveling domain